MSIYPIKVSFTFLHDGLGAVSEAILNASKSCLFIKLYSSDTRYDESVVI